MLLEQYVQQDGEYFSFTRQQASGFAKQVASDFNPIHDEDAKRFCVPGDLLFSYLLTRYGVSQHLSCQFAGMVGADIALHCAEEPGGITILDDQNKKYLSLQRSGPSQNDLNVIEPLIKDYVRFSGQNFPHILQPLMQRHNVMINAQRPLVIYESMALEFELLPSQKVDLSLTASSLSVEGKRGNALLQFSLKEDGKLIGVGEKRMILSNLVPYDEMQMTQMVLEYNHRKAMA